MTGNDLRESIRTSGLTLAHVAKKMNLRIEVMTALLKKVKLSDADLLCIKDAGIELRSMDKSDEEIRLQNLVDAQALLISKLTYENDKWRNQVRELLQEQNKANSVRDYAKS